MINHVTPQFSGELRTQSYDDYTSTRQFSNPTKHLTKDKFEAKMKVINETLNPYDVDYDAENFKSSVDTLPDDVVIEVALSPTINRFK